MLVNLNAVITIHCRTFFPLLLFHLKVPLSHCVCARVLICVPSVQSEQANSGVNECKRRTREGGGGGAHAVAAQYVTCCICLSLTSGHISVIHFAVPAIEYE